MTIYGVTIYNMIKERRERVENWDGIPWITSNIHIAKDKIKEYSRYGLFNPRLVRVK